MLLKFTPKTCYDYKEFYNIMVGLEDSKRDLCIKDFKDVQIPGLREKRSLLYKIITWLIPKPKNAKKKNVQAFMKAFLQKNENWLQPTTWMGGNLDFSRFYNVTSNINKKYDLKIDFEKTVFCGLQNANDNFTDLTAAVKTKLNEANSQLSEITKNRNRIQDETENLTREQKLLEDTRITFEHALASPGPLPSPSATMDNAFRLMEDVASHDNVIVCKDGELVTCHTAILDENYFRPGSKQWEADARQKNSSLLSRLKKELNLCSNVENVKISSTLSKYPAGLVRYLISYKYTGQLPEMISLHLIALHDLAHFIGNDKLREAITTRLAKLSVHEKATLLATLPSVDEILSIEMLFPDSNWELCILSLFQQGIINNENAQTRLPEIAKKLDGQGLLNFILGLEELTHANQNEAWFPGFLCGKERTLKVLEERKEVWTKTANQGCATTQNNLGYMYQYGFGVAPNYAEALEWYQKAADQGDAAAQNNLGKMYEQGFGVAPNYAEALEWYQKAADQGDAAAQNNLGKMYEQGFNYTTALEWYQKAADQGCAAAESSLSDIYLYHGPYITQDHEKTLEWYQKAADQGNAIAQNYLRYMPKQGFGVAPNYAKVQRLYYLQKGN